MPFTEDDLTRRLRNGESEPTRNDSDELWAAISGGLPAAAGTAVTGTAIYWWLPILVLTVLGGACYLSVKPPAELAGGFGIESTAAAETTTGPTADLIPATDDEDPIVDAPTTVASSVPSQSTSRPVLPARKGTFDNGRSSSNLISTEARSDEFSEAPPANSSFTRMGGATSSLTPNPRQRPNSVSEPVANLPLLPINRLPAFLVVPERSVQPVLTAQEKAKTFVSKPARWSLGAAAGTNRMVEKFRATTGEGTGQQLTDATSGAAGQSAAFTVGYRIGKGVSLRTGLEYHRTHSLLRYAFTFDTTATHPSFDDELTRGKGTYRVDHNNHLEWASLPLQVSYERSLGRFTAGLAIGANFNYQLRATGRTIGIDGFAKEVSTAGETDRFHVSYRLQPTLALPVSKDGRWNLQLSTRLERLDFGNSNHSLTDRKAWLYGASFGVIYR